MTVGNTGNGNGLCGMIPEACNAALCRRLFVYGSLRRGFDLYPFLLRLGTRYLAEGKMAAELFDLGRYAGARPARGTGKWVRGEIYLLRHPLRDLKVLDKIEGFVPGGPGPSEFVRATAKVIRHNGALHPAWIYWWRAKFGATRRIASGDYAAGRGGRRSAGGTHG